MRGRPGRLRKRAGGGPGSRNAIAEDTRVKLNAQIAKAKAEADARAMTPWPLPMPVSQPRARNAKAA